MAPEERHLGVYDMASHLAHSPNTERWSPRRGRVESPVRARGARLGRSSAPAASSDLDATQSPQAIAAEKPRSWRREIVLLGVLYFAYTASRLASVAPPDAASRNAQGVLDLERMLHIAPERSLNDLLFSAPRWLSIASSYYYETLHYAMTAGTLIWLYRSSPAAYRRARTWLVSMTFPALIAFWLFPVAPPRTTPGAVTHDIIAEQHQYGWWGGGGGTAPRGLAGLTNVNAAMPSLHVGWALWVGWNLVHSARNPVVRAFGYLYPVLTILVVISTGNHYLLDVLAGALLAFAAKIVVDRAAGRLRPRPLPRLGHGPRRTADCRKQHTPRSTDPIAKARLKAPTRPPARRGTALVRPSRPQGRHLKSQKTTRVAMSPSPATRPDRTRQNSMASYSIEEPPARSPER